MTDAEELAHLLAQRRRAGVWGAEVNAASKLGKELAQGGEILGTAPFYTAVADQPWAAHGTLFDTRPVYKRMNGSAPL